VDVIVADIDKELAGNVAKKAEQLGRRSIAIEDVSDP
jgi:hypothetical protein